MHIADDVLGRKTNCCGLGQTNLSSQAAYAGEGGALLVQAFTLTSVDKSLRSQVRLLTQVGIAECVAWTPCFAPAHGRAGAQILRSGYPVSADLTEASIGTANKKRKGILGSWH